MTQLTISLNRGQPEMELGVEVGATGHRVVDKKCEGTSYNLGNKIGGDNSNTIYG